MAEETKDQTLEGNEEEPQTPEKDGKEKETPKETKEEVNYQNKFKASQKEAIRLKKENDEFKTKKPEISDDEKKIRDVLDKRETEKAEAVKADDKALKEELDQLHEIHGDFDDTKLMKIVEHYGCYDEEGNVKWERGLELYNQFGGKVPEPKKTKIPSSQKTTDTAKKEPFDVTKKSMWQISEDAKKEISE